MSSHNWEIAECLKTMKMNRVTLIETKNMKVSSDKIRKHGLNLYSYVLKEERAKGGVFLLIMKNL